MPDERTRRALRLVAAAAGGLARASYRSDLLTLLARVIGESLEAPCVVTALASTPPKHGMIEVATHGDPSSKLVALLSRGDSFANSTLATLAADGTRVLSSEDFAVRFSSDHRAEGALLVCPIRDHDSLIAAIAVPKGSFDKFDLQIVEILATEAARSLYALRDRTAEEDDHDAHAQRFLDAIVENIPDMVFVKEARQLAFVRFNKAGEDLLGIPRDQMIGKSDFDFFPPSEAEFFVQKDRETLANKALVVIAEEPIHTARGTRWLHTKKVPIVDQHGVPRYLLGISSDITELKQTLADLSAAKEAAEAAVRELESFSYSVAHDLRAPLRAIDGFSQALLEDFGDRLNEVGHNYLGRVRANAQRMAGLIDDLLELSRVTRWELKRSTVDVGAIARESMATLHRLDPSRDVEVTVQPQMIAKADPKLLAIVFDNLCGNAWKFTSKRGHARIEIGKHDGVFFVRDNGVGFDPKYTDKLFGVFHRLHPDSEFPGTGIGLATVQRIVVRHGGRVWAEGKVGEGATFHFTLGDVP